MFEGTFSLDADQMVKIGNLRNLKFLNPISECLLFLSFQYMCVNVYMLYDVIFLIALVFYGGNKIAYIARDKFRTKRLSTGANYVHVYIGTWDKGILKFNKFSM